MVSKNVRSFIVGISILILLWLLAYATGQWRPNMDGRITEMYVCDTNRSLRTATEFVTTTEQLYICGIVEGTTFTRVAFYLFRNDNNVYSTSERLDIGEFFIPIPKAGSKNIYEPGSYRLSMLYDRPIVAEIKFEIVPP